MLSVPVAGRAGGREDHYDSIIAAESASARGRFAVPFALVKAIIRQESAFRADAVSRAGARGLMQIMPATAVRLGTSPDHLFDPARNIGVGVHLLSGLLDQYDGDVISALVAYNAGPRGRVKQLPRNGETPEYVWRVLALYERYSRGANPATPTTDATRVSSALPYLRSAMVSPATARP